MMNSNTVVCGILQEKAGWFPRVTARDTAMKMENKYME